MIRYTYVWKKKKREKKKKRKREKKKSTITPKEEHYWKQQIKPGNYELSNSKRWTGRQTHQTHNLPRIPNDSNAKWNQPSACPVTHKSDSRVAAPEQNRLHNATNHRDSPQRSWREFLIPRGSVSAGDLQETGTQYPAQRKASRDIQQAALHLAARAPSVCSTRACPYEPGIRHPCPSDCQTGNAEQPLETPAIPWPHHAYRPGNESESRPLSLIRSRNHDMRDATITCVCSTCSCDCTFWLLCDCQFARPSSLSTHWNLQHTTNGMTSWKTIP